MKTKTKMVLNITGIMVFLYLAASFVMLEWIHPLSFGGRFIMSLWATIVFCIYLGVE